MGTLYIGLDVHKASIAVSLAEDGRDGAVRFLGEIPNTPTDVSKLAKRLGKDGERLEFCYEAGCLRLGNLSPAGRARARLHGGGADADPEQTGRPSEDKPARRPETGGASPVG
jgi:hypothetical protein